VSTTLKQTGYKVSCFSSAANCVEQLSKQDCDLLITDLKMPYMDGLTLLEETRRVAPWVSTMVVTGYGDIPTAVEAIKLGAVDFVEKPLNKEVFLRKVRSALNQDNFVNSPAGKALTKTEKKVLKLVLEGKGNKDIVYRLKLAERTVKLHRSNIMRKLGVDNLVDLVKQAAKMGLLESPSGDRESRTRQIDLSEFGKMIAGIRHDLVSALGVISTTMDLLCSDVHNPKCVDDLKRITLATRYCGLVLGNLSDLVAHTMPNKVPLDVAEVLDEVIEIMASRIRPGICISKHYESNVPPIVADKGQIQRVFMNLIDNALQAMPDDGRLSISIQQELRTKAKQFKRVIVVKISDTGIGIPKKNLKKIFDLAFSTKRQGYGIGLYTVKQILEQHKGSIHVESQEQERSTFTVFLPVEKNK